MHNTKPCIVLLVFLCSIIFAYPQYVDELMEEATTHYFDEEYDKAYELSIKVLEISPDHPYVHFFIAEYYAFQTEFEKAIEHFDLAIEYHTVQPFELAHFYRAISTIVLHKDLSFCDDLNTLSEWFNEDDTYLYLVDRDPYLFELCEQRKDLYPHQMVETANWLAKEGYCGFSLLFYNEADRYATLDELAEYDKSICEKK